MTRRHRLHPVYPAVLLSVACGGGYRSPGNLPAPTPAPPQPAPAVPTPNALMFTPGTTRYLVRQDVHGQQDYAGMPPTYDLRYAIYLTAVIATPGDSIGLPTTFTVDSIVVDSATRMPQQVDLAAARAYRVTGRLVSTGEFISGPCDTAAAARVASLLPRFRSFFPRLPASGVLPQTSWTDSTSATDQAACSGGTTLTTRAANRRAATTWEDRDGVRALRLETSATYQFNGSNAQSGSPFTLSGTGMGTSVQFLSSDGRYLGGETNDSTTFTIDFTDQGVSIPRRQRARTTVTVLPR
ncbi:MAG TPA: hypothetical protein VKP10_16440 [Gemmatimonadales bacterium]|nr:hypothetical protein [Gemmatimonadales bacterium]